MAKRISKKKSTAKGTKLGRPKTGTKTVSFRVPEAVVLAFKELAAEDSQLKLGGAVVVSDLLNAACAMFLQSRGVEVPGYTIEE